MLIGGLLILVLPLQELYDVAYIAYQAQPTTCQVDRWEQRSESRYILYYLSDVPWEVNPIVNQREFSSEQSDRYTQGETFDCYYNVDYRRAQLSRYEISSITQWLPWIAISLLIIGSSIRHFFCLIW